MGGFIQVQVSEAKLNSAITIAFDNLVGLIGTKLTIPTGDVTQYVRGDGTLGTLPVSWGSSGNSGTNPATDFLGTTDAQPLILRTNSTERIRILSGGNVGIGIATPGAPLDVNGNTWIRGQLYTDTISTFGSGFLTLNGAQGFQMNANGGAAMRLFMNGNVAIGTVIDTGYKLQVNGNISIGATYKLLMGSSSVIGGAFIKSSSNEIYIGEGTAQRIVLSRGTFFDFRNVYFKGVDNDSNLDFKTGASGSPILFRAMLGDTVNYVWGRDMKLGGTTGGVSSGILLEVVGKAKVQTINISNIPTSATGLSAGDVWNDGGILKIV